MAEKTSFTVENDTGCGWVGVFYQRGALKLRKTSTVPPLPEKKHRGSVCDTTFLDDTKPAKPPLKLVESVPKQPSVVVTPRSSGTRDQNLGRRYSDGSRNSTSSLENTRKVRKDLNLPLASIASETTHRGNILHLGNLSNLKQQARKSSSNGTTRESSPRTPIIMGNILKKTESNQQNGNIYRGLMNKLDPEELKSRGNQMYNQGRLEEALTFYNQAIAIDSSKAAYYSNQSAALMGLGHLIEAVFACLEAIRIEPDYHNGHLRLADLCLKLGEAEKAIIYFKKSGYKVDSKEITEAQAIQILVGKCNEARKLREWKTLLSMSQRVLLSGADSAPQIYAMKAEALLKLHRHEEAVNTFETGPNFDIELCIGLFGSANSAYQLIIRSQVYMAAGRFEDAVAAAYDAARIDPSDEINAIAKRVRDVTKARLNGNRLFKASKFSEAFVAYMEGLEQEPYNALLLCNRAACRSKLGQYEKAVEDCTAALKLRPSYTKATLRKADCNAKMGRWKAAILDYEVLLQENYEDQEIQRKLLDANLQLHKQLKTVDVEESTYISKQRP